MKLGICGLANAGKDTAAVILQELLTLDSQTPQYTIDRYAKPLKVAARTIFGDKFDGRDYKEVPVKVDQDTVIEASFKALRSAKLTDEEMDKASELFFDHIGFYNHLSPRKYQQLLGTEVGRATRSTIWSDRLTKCNRNIIVPDVRFGSELLDVNILIRRTPVGLHGTVHASELLATEMLLGLDESYTAMIGNTGTIEDLKSNLQSILHLLK